MKSKAKPTKESKANESSEYVVFQNPNHNVLPDYHQVLKNNSTKNANAQKINNNINNNIRRAQEEEENIFNLGKAPTRGYEKENFGKALGSGEDNLGNEHDRGK